MEMSRYGVINQMQFSSGMENPVTVLSQKTASYEYSLSAFGFINSTQIEISSSKLASHKLNRRAAFKLITGLASRLVMAWQLDGLLNELATEPRPALEQLLIGKLFKAKKLLQRADNSSGNGFSIARPKSDADQKFILNLN
jgi:hypothetical protein